MATTGILTGDVGRGRGVFLKTFMVDAEISLEPIFVDPAASYISLLPILGGTPITASLGGGRDLQLTEPTD